LFFLISPRIIAIVTGHQYKAGKFRMSELAMAPFATLNANKSSSLQVRNQLANFSWHHGNVPETDDLCQLHF
jgi:hypothetical protein